MWRVLVLAALVGLTTVVPVAAQGERWLVIERPTDVYSMTDEVLWTAQPGEWYRWVTTQEGWYLAVWEHDPPENQVWIPLDGRISLRILSPSPAPPPAVVAPPVEPPAPPSPIVIVVTATPVPQPQVVVVVAPTVPAANYAAAANQACDARVQDQRQTAQRSSERLVTRGVQMVTDGVSRAAATSWVTFYGNAYNSFIVVAAAVPACSPLPSMVSLEQQYALERCLDTQRSTEQAAINEFFSMANLGMLYITNVRNNTVQATVQESVDLLMQRWSAPGMQARTCGG